MKKLKNIVGVKALTKKAQKTIIGGAKCYGGDPECCGTSPYQCGIGPSAGGVFSGYLDGNPICFCF